MTSFRSYLFASLLLPTSACLDVERVAVSTSVGVDGSAFDRSECVRCMSADSDPETSCATAVAECQKFAPCGGTLACTLRGCVGVPFPDFITCVNVCVKDNMLIGGAPGSEIAVSVYQCLAIKPCRSKCIVDPPDAG